MSTPRVHLLPPGTDLLDQAARSILARHRDALPDLSRLTVLLPFHGAAPQLRRALARHAGRGLLGPTITMLAQFAQARAPQAGLSALDCRLRLTSALSRHRHLLPGIDPAQAADSLFTLFEDLIAHGLAPADEAGWTARLREGYGAPDSAFLGREAAIAAQLFKAYVEDTEGRSPAALLNTQMKSAFAGLMDNESVCLLGFDELRPAEHAALKPALEQGRAELWLHGRREGRDGVALDRLCRTLGIDPLLLPGTPDARAGLLDAAFGLDTLPPKTGDGGRGFELMRACGPEHEARCVDLAVRRALLDDPHCDIALVSEDRRLARRLRALLERAGVNLHDPVGWALSTSSAAAALNAWFDCVDQHFHFRPLLTLLKSSFFGIDAGALRQLEHELVYRRHLERGLERFLDAARGHASLHAVLTQLQAAAALMPDARTAVSGERHCRALREALRELGLESRLQADAAGARLLALLDELGRALREHPLMLDAAAFRALLDRLIEDDTFLPEPGRGGVRLLTLAQSANLRCDLLILAGATREHWPGSAPADPLFNNAVRRALGLPDWSERLDRDCARLRRVLQAAPRVLVSCAPQQPGEDAVLSPWLEAVFSLSPPRKSALPDLAASTDAEISERGAALPAPTQRPAPTPRRVPARLSASGHQALVDCPYKFHVRDILGLREPQAPDEDPDRSDYGDRVHEILRRYAESPASGEATAMRLERIAGEVFGPDLRSRALAQFWVAEFRASLPRLAQWLDAREAAQVRAEVALQRPLASSLLEGRVDRLELSADGRHTIADYKTGNVPKKAEVESGEQVQLPHYAALDAAVSRVEYAALKDGQKTVTLHGAELNELREAVLKRLTGALDAIASGAPLPAHGDDKTCERCDYRGLCRKADWSHDDTRA